MTNKLNLENIAIVLIETITPGNIGAITRAMKNMGFADLRLVNPQNNYLNEEARRLAHGSQDILENTKVYKSLDEATADCVTLVATSHQKTRYKIRSYHARNIGEHLAPYCFANKIAIIFGREDHGLNNDEVKKCSFIVNIPTFRSYPAINLSKAVMIVCYELFMTSSQEKNYFPKLVTQNKMGNFYNLISNMLVKLKFPHKNDDPTIFMDAIKRIFGRTGLQEQEISVLIKLFSYCTSPRKNKEENNE